MTREEAKAWIKQTCGKGWLPLVDSVFDNLHKNLVIKSVYQKWGALHFDVDPYDENFYLFLVEVEEKSMRLCEVCGERSGGKTVNGWVRSLCEKHYLEIMDEHSNPDNDIKIPTFAHRFVRFAISIIQSLGEKKGIDNIIEIGIDKKERLYIKPSSKKFPYIYREAMEVHWDVEGSFLYGPKPRNWSYIEWYKQIIKAAKEQSCELSISDETVWVNIPDPLKNEILKN